MWWAYCRGDLPQLGTRPRDIPAKPDVVYRSHGWINWSDWLGAASTIHRVNHRPFHEARAFARDLGLKTTREWKAYCRGDLAKLGARPHDIPASPAVIYRGKGWNGWRDWLGTEGKVRHRREYRAFKAARTFARRLRLKNSAEWKSYCQGELLHRTGLPPADIPARPASIYRGRGWISWGDWLGSGYVATAKRRYRPFKQARVFARALELLSHSQWEDFCRGDLPGRGSLPNDIPANPRVVYNGTGWRSWPDWLGSANLPRAREFRSLVRARRFVRSLGLETWNAWLSYCRGDLKELGEKPSDIPSCPWLVYKEQGWISRTDWLGAIALGPFRPFSEARAFVRALDLKDTIEWKAYSRGALPRAGKRPSDIPAHPDSVYRDQGWISWRDWIGIQRSEPHHRYRPFPRARAFVRALGLANSSQWKLYSQGKVPESGSRPGDIPSHPDEVYADVGWVDWRDWLGTEGRPRRRRQFRSFDDARAFARRLGLFSTEWQAYSRGDRPDLGVRPDDIPAAPDKVYRAQGWRGWGDWLGTENRPLRRRKYRPFKQARQFARRLGLKSASEWKLFSGGAFPNLGVRPDDIPGHPDEIYRELGWAGWSDWIGRR